MASVSLYLDKRRCKIDGTFPLKLKISIGSRGGFLVPLKISLKEDQWKDGEVVKHPNRKFLNAYIKQRYLDIGNLLFKLEATGTINSMQLSEVKKLIETGGDLDRDYTFSDHYDRFISNCDKKSTQDIYRQTLLKIELFSPGKLGFSDINTAWLKGFEQFLKEQGLSINSINIHMRNIRAVFNDAINEDKTEQNLYPFRKFKLKTEKTRKRSLTVEQIRAIKNWPCEDHEKQYIDIFMLIFYLIGINIIDLVNLKEITNGRIEYRRAKTGRLYSIMVEPEAEDIINKYRGRNFLLNIGDRYSNYKDYLLRINRNLKGFGNTTVGKRGKKIKDGAFPYLSTYYARHSWATIAASLDIPKETIAAALGHGGNTTTDIYIDFDQRKVDEANRRVIDWVVYGK